LCHFGRRFGFTGSLTTGVDQGSAFSGTANDDTFTGQVDTLSAVAATSTFNVGDVLVGGLGIDTLSIITTGANGTAGTISAASVSGIENINIRALLNTATDITTVTATNFVGATAFNADRATSAVTFADLAAGQSAGMIGNASATNGAMVAGYAATVTAATLNIAGGTKAGAVTETGAGITSTVINSTGAANTIGAVGLVAGNTALTVNASTNLTTGALTAAGLKTITVTGVGVADMTAGAVTAAVTTIDGSTNTGGTKVGALAATVTSFKGGSGADQVTTAAITSTTAGIIDAGAGTADLLNVAAGADVDTAAEANLYTGFEVLRNSGTTDVDVSLVAGITSVELNYADAGATKLTAAQAANINVRLSNATNTIALTTATGTTDVVGLTLAPVKAADVATAIDVTALTVTGFETLNVVSSSGVKAGGTGTGNDLAFAAAANLTAINVSGEYDLTIAAANVTKVATVTSTQTGTASLYVSGDFAVGSSVTGSVGADAFVFGAVGTSYNGGAGNDTMSATQAQLNTGAVYSAANGGDGTDTLNLTGGGAITIVDNVLSKVTGFEKIVIATTTTNNQSITTGGFFDAAFKANGIDLTTTSTTGTITVDMTSFTGAAKITATTADGGAGGSATSIQTGAGADTVTSTATATTAAGTISTFDGNDTIVDGVNDTTITGGKGQDTMTGGATTANIFAFVAGDTGLPSATGFDTITDFAAVAANVISVGAQLVLGSASTAAAGMAGLGAANGVAATFNAADTTFAQKLAAVENALSGNTNTNLETAIFVDSGNTYVFIADGVVGIGANDLLIKLVGVDGTNAGFDVATLAGQTLTLA
jgi:hypothetical protein